METNQSEQHFYLSPSMQTSAMLQPAQYHSCTVNIGSNKSTPPTNYTIVPNIMTATANNNMTVGAFNSKFNEIKFAQSSSNNNSSACNYGQFITQTNSEMQQEYKLFLANNHQNSFRAINNPMNNAIVNINNTKKLYGKRNCLPVKSNDSSNNDNITVAPNQLTILVQEVLPAQLPDNNISSTISSSSEHQTHLKAQKSSAVISNSDFMLTSSISDCNSTNTIISNSNSMLSSDKINSTGVMVNTHDTISEVIQEVLNKAISSDSHDDVFLSIIKARENGSLQENLDLDSNSTTDNCDLMASPRFNNQQMEFSQRQMMYNAKQIPQNTNTNNHNGIQQQNFSNIKSQINQKLQGDVTLNQFSQSPKNNLIANNNTGNAVKRRNISNIQKTSLIKKQKLTEPNTGNFIYDNQNFPIQQQQQQQRCVSQMANKMGLPNFRKLVHEPKLNQNNLPDLLPIGCNLNQNIIRNPLKHCLNLEQLQDNCIKYRRLPFALAQPNPCSMCDCSGLFVPNSSTSSDKNPASATTNNNNFILQNINAIIPEGAMLSSRDSDEYIDCVVAPSPTTSESDYMRTFSDQQHCNQVSLEMLKPPQRISSPQLSIFHSPKKSLDNNNLPDHDQSINNISQPESLLKSTGISRIQISHQSTTSPIDSNQLSESAQIDSETGEVVNKIQETKTIRDKLLVTFTLNPLDNVEKSVKSITQMLGIDYNSVGLKLTTSGGEISIDKSSIVDSKLDLLPKELTDSNNSSGSMLLNHTSNKISASYAPSSGCSSTTNINNNCVESSSYHNSTGNINNNNPITTNTNTIHGKLFQPIYPEAIFKSSQLVSSRSVISSQIKSEPISESHSELGEDGSSFNVKPNEQCQTKEQYIYIGEECTEKSVISQGSISKLKQYNRKYMSNSNLNSNNGFNCNADKYLPGNSGYQYSGNSSSNGGSSLILRKKSSPLKGSSVKLFKGSKYTVYTANRYLSSGQLSNNIMDEDDDDIEGDLIQLKKLTRSSQLEVYDYGELDVCKDLRKCVLCNQSGDRENDSLGRLLCMEIDEWIHVACGVWLDTCYETDLGSLMNIKLAVNHTRRNRCMSCNKLGAGVHCNYRGCTSKFHVPCALVASCVFYSNHSVYCDMHSPQTDQLAAITNHAESALTSFDFYRKLFCPRINIIEELQTAINNDDRCYGLRIGTLYVHCIGQLFPHQIQSGKFHNLNYVYPIGYQATRIHWSSRINNKRCKYLCEIILDSEMPTRPLFRVSVPEESPDHPAQVYESLDCTETWSNIIKQCAQYQAKITNQESIKGEELFGLTDAYVLRIIESLPGLECLSDYAFKYGRIQLLSQMPLPINPSGSQRTESYNKINKQMFYPQKLFVHQSPNYSGKYSISSTTNNSNFNAFVSSRSNNLVSKWQQYRKLKSESRLNVVLKRSRVEGLGLFAARDIEKGTMIIEYIGQLIRNEVANLREKKYQHNKQGIYMFRLNTDTVIDATKAGDLARYINHSCEPNCHTEQLEFDKDNSHIVIISSRKIDKDEELNYDYKFDLDDETSDEKIPCLCGARNCRRWMN